MTKRQRKGFSERQSVSVWETATDRLRECVCVCVHGCVPTIRKIRYTMFVDIHVRMGV